MNQTEVGLQNIGVRVIEALGHLDKARRALLEVDPLTFPLTRDDYDPHGAFRGMTGLERSVSDAIINARGILFLLGPKIKIPVAHDDDSEDETFGVVE